MLFCVREEPLLMLQTFTGAERSLFKQPWGCGSSFRVRVRKVLVLTLKVTCTSAVRMYL